VSNYVYALGDADSIRKKIQGLLLSGELEALARFSAALTAGVRAIAQIVQESIGGKVIFAGGDDILVRFDRSSFSRDLLHDASHRFEQIAGATISFGIGLTAEEAFLNLARAKSMRPGSIFLSSSISGESAESGY
jgi:hypothetical protein